MTKRKLWKKVGAVLMTAALSVGVMVSPVGSMEAKAASTISATVIPGNGSLTVNWSASGYTLIGGTGVVGIYLSCTPSGGVAIVREDLTGASGTYTFTGLTNGVECAVHINLLGINDDSGEGGVSEYNTTATPSASAGGSSSSSSASASKDAPRKSAFDRTTDRYSKGIKEAKTGSSVKIKGDASFNALPNSLMKDLLKKKDVDLEFSYEYKGMSYTIKIPAGAAENNDIPWYGPMYLWGKYGVSSSPVVAAK